MCVLLICDSDILLIVDFFSQLHVFNERSILSHGDNAVCLEYDSWEEEYPAAYQYIVSTFADVGQVFDFIWSFWSFDLEVGAADLVKSFSLLAGDQEEYKAKNDGNDIP